MIHSFFSSRQLASTLLVLLGFACFSPLQSQTDSRFGLHIQPIIQEISYDDAEQLTIAGTAGAGIVRIDAFPDEDHPRYEPNWKLIVNALATEADLQQMKVMLTLRYQSLPVGQDMTDYLSDITDIFNHSGNKIQYLQLENEVYGGLDDQVWDATGGSGYVCLLEEVHGLVTTFTNTPKIVLAGIPFGLAKLPLPDTMVEDNDCTIYPAMHTPEEFLAYTLIYGQGYYDAIDLHYYGFYEDMDDDFTGFIDEVKEMNLTGIKPLWITEAGSVDLRNYGIGKNSYKFPGGCVIDSDCSLPGQPLRAFCHEENGEHGCLPDFCDPAGTREDCYTNAIFFKLQAERVVKRMLILLAEEEEDPQVTIGGVMWHSLHRANPDEFGSWVSLMVGGVPGDIDGAALKRPGFHTYQLMTDKFAGYTELQEMGEGQYRIKVGGVNHYVLWDDGPNPNSTPVDLSGEQGATSHVKVTHIVTALDANGDAVVIPDCRVPSDGIPVGQTPKIVTFCDQTSCPQDNCSSSASKISVDTPIYNFELFSNYPNPFNPETTIRYSLREDIDVTIAIYNSLGQEVVTLLDELQNAGPRSVRWDGTDSNGNQVSGGTYIYRLRAGEFVQTRTMVLVK